MDQTNNKEPDTTSQASRIFLKTAPVSLIALIIIILLGITYGSIQQNFNREIALWSSYTSLERQKSTELRHLITNIGYGGFIHNLKNAVLRSDSSLILLSQQQITNAQDAIDQFLKIEPTALPELSIIRNTLDEYYQKSQVAARMIAAGNTPTEIDMEIRVSDSSAVSALSRIIESLNQTPPLFDSEAGVNRKSFYIKLWGTFCVMAISLLLAFAYIWNITIKSLSALHEKLLIVELAPNAIMTANEHGTITSANTEALRLFELSEQDIDNINVDDLVPEDMKHRHMRYREDFQQSDRTVPMSQRFLDFYGKRRSGGIFPVNISVATHTEMGKKNSIMIIKDLSEELDYLKQANTDSLTHTANRRALDDTLRSTIARSNRQAVDFCVALIDIDFFKQINDKHGHVRGDEALIELTQVITQRIRETDFFGRWGGEEFFLIMEGTSKTAATEFCDKIRQRVEQHFQQTDVPLTVSIGVAEHRPNQSSEQLLAQADTALYEAKESGRNRTICL